MKVWTITEGYEGVDSIYATREAAEAALERLLAEGELSEFGSYFVEEWTVHQ